MNSIKWKAKSSTKTRKTPSKQIVRRTTIEVLRDILKDDESEEPLYKKPNTRTETSTLRFEDFDNYWRPLWETEAHANLEADWIQSIEQLIKSKVKPTSSNFRFLTETFTKCVKKKELVFPREW